MFGLIYAVVAGDLFCFDVCLGDVLLGLLIWVLFCGCFLVSVICACCGLFALTAWIAIFTCGCGLRWFGCLIWLCKHLCFCFVIWLTSVDYGFV